MEKIAFIGLGAMGRPMANTLLSAGWSLNLFNRTPGKAQGLPGACTVAASPAEAPVATATPNARTIAIRGTARNL